MIPQASPQKRIARFKTEVEDAIRTVLESESYILGSAVANFERDFATASGIAHAVAVASGTDALTLCLRALKLQQGDEVITPALTFAGAGQSILQAGLVPVFVEVDPESRCIDVAAATAAITSRTAAIMPVHLFGMPCDMHALSTLADRHGLAIIEDCAQAHGATLDGRPLGSFGKGAAFSFYPTKNLGAIGDGGAVLTDDANFAEEIRRLRNYGFNDSRRVSQTLGFNSRLDEVQAAILSVLLRHLDEGNQERRAGAQRYRTFLADLPIGLPPENPGCVFHQFAITCPERDRLREHLAWSGIGTAIHYHPPLHRHPVFAPYCNRDLPVTEKLSASLISLPIQPEIVGDGAEKVVAAIRSFFA